MAVPSLFLFVHSSHADYLKSSRRGSANNEGCGGQSASFIFSPMSKAHHHHHKDEESEEEVVQQDEQLDMGETFEVEPGSEAISEPLFEYGLTALNWDDMMSASLVSYGWHHGVNQAIATSTKATKLFQAKFTDEAVRPSV